MAAQYDVIVVGAGVAGGAMATALARDGRRVLCVERHLWASEDALCEPDRIVGELLQPGGYRALSDLGLADALEGIDAQRIFGYGVFLGERAACIDYESNDAPVDGIEAPGELQTRTRAEIPAETRAEAQAESPPQDSQLPLAGRSFHNGRFLKRLREIARDEENVDLIEGRVVALEREERTGRVIGVSYKEGRGGEMRRVRAPLTIACDGCASNLRKRANPDAVVDVYSQFVGLVLDVTRLPYPCHGHVVLADPAPILFYPISGTEVRCLVDIPSSVSAPVTEHMLQVLAPQIPKDLRRPFEEAIRSGDVKMMPNRVMPETPAVVPGAILLGDSFNMRHPLTGGGMTVALSDVLILRDLLSDVGDLTDDGAVSTVLELFYRRRKPLSTTINILANALYSVFCASDDPALKEMRDACFEYLTRGGRRSHDPMGMLGGVKPSPILLLTHFFGVALFGCGRAMLPFPTPSRVSKAWSIFRASFNIVKPLCDDEHVFPLSLLPFSSIPTISFS